MNTIQEFERTVLAARGVRPVSPKETQKAQANYNLSLARCIGYKRTVIREQPIKLSLSLLGIIVVVAITMNALFINWSH